MVLGNLIVANEMRALLRYIHDLEKDEVPEDAILILVMKQIEQIIKTCESRY